MAVDGAFNAYNIRQAHGDSSPAYSTRTDTITASPSLQYRAQPLPDASFSSRPADSIAQPHPSKRRRTNSYLAPHESDETAYGAFAPLPQDARATFAPYSQPAVEQSYFHMNNEMPHSGHQQQQQQQQPALYHSESSIDSISSAYPNYVHEPAMLQHHHEAASESWDPMLFDSGLQLKVQNLPVLDNCATKILEALSSPNLQEVLETATQPESGRGQAYSTQVALFDQMKKYYSRDHLFLNAQLLNLDPSANEIIRKTNLATFASVIFAARDVPFSELHANCLNIFLPNGGGLTKPVANLLLELKTQAYLAAIHNGGSNQQELLEYFSSDIQGQLSRRRPGTPPLSPIEQDFVGHANIRRQQLINEQYSPYPASFYQTWPWVNLLRILCECLRLSLHSGLNVSTPVSADFSTILFANSVHAAPMPGTQTSPAQAETTPFPIYHEPSTGSAPLPPRTESARSTSQTSAGASRGRGPSSSSKDEKAPMQHQYEKARASTTTKPTPPTRRVSVASQRKPWSTDEEKALMDGLDRVKGPHWSQILALYGVGGRISEVLKERTQVQLKDKARNLKLFFLKSGIEVPTYLQGVTGELKTRAPAQAAKREREERLKAEREAQEKSGQNHSAAMSKPP